MSHWGKAWAGLLPILNKQLGFQAQGSCLCADVTDPLYIILWGWGIGIMVQEAAAATLPPVLAGSDTVLYL